jgi:C4-dicarboxylate transporter DctM subunit
MIIRIPIAISLGVSSIIFILLKGGEIPLMIAAQRMIVALDSFALLAVPLFIFAGELMNAGGITNRLIRFAEVLLGRFAGGLSYVVIFANMVMAGMSGSAVADVAGTGTILIPAMTKAKYPKGFASVIVAAASTVGPIIPPSIPFVVYGILSATAIDKLFLGGAIPGFLMGLYLMVVSYIISKRRRFEKGEIFPFRMAIKTGFVSLGALLMPFLVIGGMVFGAFTATEAAGIAVGYAMVLGFFIYRELKPKDIPEMMIRTIITSANVFFIIATASLFGWLLIREGIPFVLERFISSLSTNPFVIMILINIIVLILGCFIEVMSILIILVPVLIPTLNALQIDFVYFGVVLVLNLMIGFLTPPVGMGMYIVCSISKISIEEYTKEVYPFLTALILALFTITFFPNIVLFLPHLF